MKQLLLAFFLLIHVYNAKCQIAAWSKISDSIEKVLEKSPSYIALENYSDISIRLLHSEPQHINRIIKNIEKASRKTDWAFGKSRTLLLRLLVMIDASKLDSASLYLEELFEQATLSSDTTGLMQYYLNKGIVLKRLSRFDQATLMYYKGLSLADHCGSYSFKMSFYNNLSSLYNSTDNYLGARKVIKEAIVIFNQNNEKGAIGLGSLYSNLAVTYKRTKQLDSALYYYEKSRKELELIYNVSVSGVYCNIGILYGDMKKYDEAEAYLQKALVLTRKYKQVNFEVNVLNSIAHIRVENKKYNEAISFAAQAASLAESKGLLDARHRSLEYLHQAYAGLGNYAMAYKLFIQSTNLVDSIYNLEKEEMMNEVKEKYESDKKDQEIVEANIRIEDQKKRSKYLWATLSIFAILFITIGILYIRTIRLNKKIASQSKAIESQNANLEKLNQIKNKLFGVISHDLRTPVSSLHSLLLLMDNPNLSTGKITQLKMELQLQLHQTTSLMENLLYWAKTQMKGWKVNFANINIKSVTDQLEARFKQVALKKNISLEFNGNMDRNIRTDPQLIDIILSNLVSNALKFTPHGGRVWGEVNYHNTGVDICICDTGEGIDEHRLPALLNEESYTSSKGTGNEQGFGFGLKICLDLAHQINGEITIQSEKGKGSRFYLSIRNT